MRETGQRRRAVLEAGVIANEMAQTLRAMGPLDGIGNRTYEKAVAFAQKYGVKEE